MIRFEPPRGTRDFLPPEMIIRNHVEQTVRSVFESYGFQPIQTPIFENYDLLAARAGQEICESMFTFASDAGRYALRPELTSPVCRLVASDALGSLPRPYKLYYFGPCFRYSHPQAGRPREFYQAGVELMGATDPLADAEVIAVAADVVAQLGIGEIKLRVGNVGVLRSLLEQHLRGPLAQEQQTRIIRHIDNIMHIREKCHDAAELAVQSTELRKLQDKMRYTGSDKIQPDRPLTAEQLAAVAESTYQTSWIADEILTAEIAKQLIQLSRLQGPPEVVVPEARRLLADTAGPAAGPALDNLDQVCKWLAAFGVRDFVVHLGLARNLDFYTGTVFEIESPRLGAQRQLCGGGRYDKLVEEFGGPATPATGFAFGFDRLVKVLAESGRGQELVTAAVVVVGPPAHRHKVVEAAAKLRTAFRKAGVRMRVDVAQGELQCQREYAGKVGAALTVLVGANDLDPDDCRVCRGAGESGTSVKLSGLADEILKQIDKKGAGK